MLYFTNHTQETNDVLILGNLDNPVDYEDYMSFSEERGRIYGTGVSRGKGGIAVLLGALKALRFTRTLKRVKIGVLFITDDSKGGGSARTILQDISSRSSYVLGLNGAGLGGKSSRQAWVPPVLILKSTGPRINRVISTFPMRVIRCGIAHKKSIS